MDIVQFRRGDEVPGGAVLAMDASELMQVQMEKDRLHGRAIAFDALESPALRT